MLQKLSLAGNNLTHKGCDALNDLLQHNNQLTTLELSYNRFGKKGAALLGEGLKANKTLLSLRVRDTRMGSDGAAFIFSAMAGIHLIRITITLRFDSIYIYMYVY